MPKTAEQIKIYINVIEMLIEKQGEFKVPFCKFP